MKASLATVAIALLVLAACGGDDGGEPEVDGSDTGTTAVGEGLTSYENVTELADALADGGIQCELEYTNLTDEETDQSLCTIDGNQAFVTIFFEEELFTAAVVPDGEARAGVAYGQNWAIELSNPDPAAAAAIAEAAGGTSASG